MEPLRKVFISHSHKDHPLAAALRNVLKEIFPSVEVAFSSDKEAGGGPVAGSNWLDWINRQIVACQEALLLLTPYSIQKPWPMWEAGAVSGIAMAAPIEAAATGQPRVKKPVTPIRFNVAEEALPGPFLVTQAFDGTSEGSLRKLLGDLMRRHDYEGSTPRAVEALLNDQVPPLHGRVLEWLRSAPSLVGEGTILEWCVRLDQLRETKRSRDVAYLHRWIHLMYDGPDSNAAVSPPWTVRVQATPWDIRLHLRLGENYAISRQPKKAIEQYELAARLAPLDVFVLHKLAKAYLDFKDGEGARATINKILELDADALKWNAEVAGLEGRYWKDRGRAAESEGRSEQARECYGKARAAYQAAMDIDGDQVSFYMADNVGQLSLKLGDPPAARRAYEQASGALQGITGRNEDVWSLATRTTAAVVLERESEALEHLARIGKLGPSEAERQSIVGGLKLLRAALKIPDATYASWIHALDGAPRGAG
jgi:tetratricopeptide (TPR) repeat protein